MRMRHGVIVLFSVFLFVFISDVGSDDLPVRGFDMPAYESSFTRVDQAGEPGAWIMQAMERGDYAVARWEREATALFGSQALFAETYDALKAWIDDDLAARYEAWLRDRFFGREAASLRIAVASSVRAADSRYLYSVNQDGTLVLDEAGNPVYLRQADDLSLEADRNGWVSSSTEAVHDAMDVYRTRLAAICPELLTYIPEDSAFRYESIIESAARSAESRVAEELDALVKKEERLFVARKTADVWSLRKRSEGETASAIAEELVKETSRACDIGMEDLRERISSASVDAGTISISGSEWLEEFSRQFDRGLDSWKNAEERFMVSRLEWERDAATSFDEGTEAWASAFARLADERRTWEIKAGELFRSGEEAFAQASDDLEESIRKAKAGFEIAAAERSVAGSERARAWVDIYAQACAAASGAREAAEYWLSSLGAGAPAFNDAGLSDWLKSESAKSGASAQRLDQIAQALDCIGLFSNYAAKAEEARDSLLEDFSLVMGQGAGGLNALLDDDRDTEAFYLDEYQIELVRAKATEGYWARRVDVARAVLQYASDVSSGRATEGESIRNLEAATEVYGDALQAYHDAEERLQSAGAAVSESGVTMETALDALADANDRLERAQGEYSMLLGAIASGDNSYLDADFASRYRELIAQSGLAETPGSPDGAALLAEYLEKAISMGHAETIERAGEALRVAVNGGGGEPGLAELSAAWKRIIVPVDPAVAPLDADGYGLEKSDPAYDCLCAILQEMQSLVDDSPSLEVKERLRMEYRIRAVLIARNAKSVAASLLEEKFDAIALLASSNADDWYTSRSGLSPVESEKKQPGQILQSDILECTRNLLLSRARIESAALGIVTGKIDGQDATDDERNLASLWHGDMEQAAAARESIQGIIKFLEEHGEDDVESYNAAIENLAHGDPLVASFIRGKGCFFAAGFDAGRACAGVDVEALNRAKGRLAAYQRYGTSSAALEDERMASAISCIDEALFDLGLSLDDEGNLPRPQDIIHAIFVDGFNRQTAVANLIAATDRAGAVAPDWMVSELTQWKESILSYAAVKCFAVDIPPTHSSAIIGNDLAELQERATELGASLSRLSGDALERMEALCGFTELQECMQSEKEMVESEASRCLAAVLVGNVIDSGLLAFDEPDWQAMESAVASDISLRFAFASDSISQNATSLAMDELRTMDALGRQRNPDGLAGAALQARLDQIWNGLDEDLIDDYASSVVSGLARAAYSMRSLVFDALEHKEGECVRDDLLAFRAPGPDGEPSWLDEYYSSEGQDAGSAMEALLDIACGGETDSWSLDSARAQVDAAASEYLSGASHFIESLSVNTGGAAVVAERFFAIRVAQLSPDAGYAFWALGKLGLNSETDYSEYAATNYLDPSAEAFLGLGSSPYASHAASTFMTSLARSGDSVRFGMYSTRAGAAASVRGSEILQIADDASYYAGEYSGDALSWASGKNPDDPEAAIRLARFIETGSEVPVLSGGGSSDLIVRWVAGRLAAEAESVLTNAVMAASNLEFASEYERVSALAEEASANDVNHWRQYVDSAAIRAIQESCGTTGPELSAPLAAGNPEGELTCVPRAATSWMEGMIADACENAQRRTSSLGSAFKAWAMMIDEIADGSSSASFSFSEFSEGARRYLLSPDGFFDDSVVTQAPSHLAAAYESARVRYLSLEYTSLDCRNALAKLGEAMALSSDENALANRLAELGDEIDAARNAHDEAMEHFREAGSSYDAAGETYETAYAAVKNLGQELEEARCSLEKEDAIQRWAGTAYLEVTGESVDATDPAAYRCPASELAYAESALARATVATAALAGLYDDGEAERPYLDPEYASAYQDYRESYRRMLLTAKARSALGDALQKEYRINDAAYDEYRNSLFGGTFPLASPQGHYSSYSFPADSNTAAWTDFLTLEPNGVLGLGFDSAFRLTAVDASMASALAEYFGSAVKLDGSSDVHGSTRYERDIRSWSERTIGYLSDASRFGIWALARDYLVTNIVKANPGFEGLASDVPRADNLYATVGQRRLDGGTVAGLLDGFQSGDLSAARLAAWNSLGEQERADLEFLVVLTLTGGAADAGNAFAATERLAEYRKAGELASQRIESSRNAARVFSLSGAAFWALGMALSWTPAGPVFLGLATVQFGLSALSAADAAEWQSVKTASIDPPSSTLAQEIRTGSSAFIACVSGVDATYTAYAASCARIASIKGAAREGVAAADDFRASLESSHVLDAADIESLIGMYREYENATGYTYISSADALVNLHEWNAERTDSSRASVERSYISDEEKRFDSQSRFEEMFGRYIDGTASIEELSALAQDSYGAEAASMKTHLAHMADMMEEVFKGANDPAMRECVEAASSYADLVARASASRYAAELAAREAEWEARRRELYVRRSSWLQASELILERGRADFIKGEDALRERARDWQVRFSDEYAARKPAWDMARADMLQEKLRWVSQATEVQADASSDALLALVGSDAEAASRKLDSFYIAPVHLDDGSSSAFDEVMDRAGIVGLARAMEGQTLSIDALSEVGGVGLSLRVIQGYGKIRSAAMDFAERSRDRLAGIQARLVAARARETAAVAMESLGEAIRSANENFNNGMHEAFSGGGSWKRQGDNYVKDIVVHSTVGTPLITELASVEAYHFFTPEAWNMRTDLSDGNLERLDASAVRALLEKVQDEVRVKSEETFGSPEDAGEDAVNDRSRRFDIYRAERCVTGSKTLTWTDDDGRTSSRTVDVYGFKDVLDHTEIRTEGAGTFGRHIGYAPVVRYGANPDGGMGDVFQADGAGELGRLMASYMYWSLKEGKGWAEASKPIYEKDLWDDRGNWLQAPTIRGITDMGVTVAAGLLTGGLGAVAMNLADDALFGMLDISGGYKSWEETGLDFGKKATMSALNFAGGQIFGSALNGMQSAGGSRGAIGAAVLGGLRTASAGVTSSAIGAIGLSHDGNGDASGLCFDRDRFIEGAFGESSVASCLGAFAAEAFGSAVDFDSALTNKALSGFTSLGTMAITEGMEYAAHLGYASARGYTGSDMFSEAWNNHGGITLDIANLGSLADAVGFISGITGKGYDAQERAIDRNIAGALGSAGLSLTIDAGGVSGSFGGGGYDLIDMGLGIGKGLALGARLGAYEESHGALMRSVLETAYGYGDFAAEETVWRIALGTDEVFLDAGSGKAQTSLAANGSRRIAMSSACGDNPALDLAVRLQHESWRDGLAGGLDDQRAETWNAVKAHTEMAILLAGSDEFGGSMASLIGLDGNYRRDIGMYLGGGFNSYVGSAYDSSDDFWKLTKEGQLLNDGKARLLVEMVNDDGSIGWNQVAGSETERSTAAALVHYLGMDRSMELFGGPLSDVSRYDDQTLRDVLNLDDVDIKVVRRNAGEANRLVATATADQRERLLGEALMKDAGIDWSVEDLAWEGEGSRLSLTDNEIHGNATIRSIGPSLYERFSITSDIERREGAYDVWKDGVKGQVGQGNTRLAFTKWDVDSGEQIATILAGGAWNSVDNSYGQADSSGRPIGDDQRYQIAFGPMLQGNTISRGPLDLRWAQTGKSDWGDVFILSGARTISGESIAADGRREGHPYDYRWLAHATMFGSSDGCLVYCRGDDEIDQFDALVKTLRSWGLYQGYSITGQLSDRNDFAYRPGFKKGAW